MSTQLLGHQLINLVSKQESLLDSQKKALNLFEAQGGFPTPKHEEWKYSNVKDIVGKQYNFASEGNLSAKDFVALNIPNLQGNILYFVNGLFHEELSQITSTPDQVIICPLATAKIKYANLVETYLNTITDQAENAFSAINGSVLLDGLFIHIAEGKTLEEPIIIRYITDTRTEAIGAMPRNLFIAEANTQINIVESYRSVGEHASFTNAITEVFVGAHADVHYYKVQNETDSAAHVGTTAVQQKDKSVFTANTITVNGGFVRNNLHIKIDGQHAVANMFGLYIPSGNQHIDNHTVVDHILPNSESNEFYKGILGDKSTGVFNGKIFVREDAQKTNAFQSCKNVLTSANATMNTKPQLEIWADDVKCSHGTTTGQLNDEALFYMQARGISKAKAKSLLTLAFAQEVIDKMEIVPIKEYLQKLVEEKLFLQNS
jgi:Fe-S cluster assembly protein SufD